MKWVIFTGSWRYTNPDVEADVRATVREVFAKGDGIVTGGATGVDYFAMDEAMKIDPTASHLLVILPAYLDSYIHDCRTNWCSEPVTSETIDALEALLLNIRAAHPASIMEIPKTLITQEDYNSRNAEEVSRADAVYAFQVNGSTGTQDTIDKAVAAGIPVELHKTYTI